MLAPERQTTNGNYDAAAGTDNLRPRVGEHLLQIHRDQKIVFDNKLRVRQSSAVRSGFATLFCMAYCPGLGDEQ